MNSKLVLRIILKNFSFRTYLLLLLSLYSYNSVLQAQWVQTNGPGNASPVLPIVVDGTNIYAVTMRDGVYISSNNGTNWEQTKKTIYDCNSLYVSDANIFVGTTSGLYLSTDKGINWTLLDNGLPGYAIIRSIAIRDTNIFVGTENGIYLSNNIGASWTRINNGMTNDDVISITVSDTYIFVGKSGSIYRSSDNGTNWTHLNIELTNHAVLALASNGANIYAGTEGGAANIFSSTDYGTTWTKSNRLPVYQVRSLALTENKVFAGTDSGVFLSTNNGTNWTNVGLPNTFIWSLALNNSDLYAGTYLTGVWRRPLSDFITGIPNEAKTLPKDIILSQNYPNPFNPNTVISYSLPLASNVKLFVFNALGQIVRLLENGYKNAGNYSVNLNASELSSGIYFYKIEAGHFSQVKKMLLLK